jgi:hypothetical protein
MPITKPCDPSTIIQQLIKSATRIYLDPLVMPSVDRLSKSHRIGTANYGFQLYVDTDDVDFPKVIRSTRFLVNLWNAWPTIRTILEQAIAAEAPPLAPEWRPGSTLTEAHLVWPVWAFRFKSGSFHTTRVDSTPATFLASFYHAEMCPAVDGLWPRAAKWSEVETLIGRATP